MLEHYLVALAEWDPCPCRQWGFARADRYGCVAMLKETE
jgi:hypothetical protein